MTSIQMDLPTANRFVNSLSKSLQALCHGCMDFDTEIEIVGYINVNIDCGSKVDYVLNEKVSKSQNNSMTFVSNSFLAKKDQPKSCKERSCSPIPELNVRNKAPTHSPFPGSQLYMSSGIYSPHSQVLRGSQKRSWAGGDWRATPRKSSRGARSHYGPYDNQQSFTNPALSSSQTQSSSFPNPSTYHQQDYNTTVTPEQPPESDVYIKTECDQSKEDSSYQSGAAAEPTGTNDGNNAYSSDVNIKADPDSSETQGNTDIKPTDSTSSFLLPQSHNDPLTSEQSNSGQEGESFLKAEQSDSTTYNEGQSSENVVTDENNGAFSESHHDQIADDQTQSSYPEEEFGDGYQFDVIEIDDEDEDITAFSGNGRLGNPPSSSSSYNKSSPSARSTRGHTQPRWPRGHATRDDDGIINAIPSNSNVPGGAYEDRAALYPEMVMPMFTTKCSFCPMALPTKTEYMRHLAISHREEMPYHCNLCEKVFSTELGLKYHAAAHEGPKFICSICDTKFTRNYSLQTHIKTIHKLFPCRVCGQMLKSMEEFKQHVLSCFKVKKT